MARPQAKPWRRVPAGGSRRPGRLPRRDCRWQCCRPAEHVERGVVLPILDALRVGGTLPSHGFLLSAAGREPGRQRQRSSLQPALGGPASPWSGARVCDPTGARPSNSTRRGMASRAERADKRAFIEWGRDRLIVFSAAPPARPVPRELASSRNGGAEGDGATLDRLGAPLTRPGAPSTSPVVEDLAAREQAAWRSSAR